VPGYREQPDTRREKTRQIFQRNAKYSVQRVRRVRGDQEPLFQSTPDLRTGTFRHCSIGFRGQRNSWTPKKGRVSKHATLVAFVFVISAGTTRFHAVDQLLKEPTPLLR
jgi:hypothetical protein